jgi:murein DD-endopeptidase MepM/ murein hydrolase activator NlpD
MNGPSFALAVVATCVLFIVLAGHRPPGGSEGGLVDPVPGAVMSQPFGCTPLELEPPSATCASGHFHSGIDLAAPAGSPVLAPAGGVARLTATDGPCGIGLWLDHGSGIEKLYCHLSSVLVAGGEKVLPGEAVATVGSTGNSTGPHVHFEVHANDRLVDPAAWLRLTPATQPHTQGGK